jgi:ABC-2 type transport system ATP-binding protein
MTAQYANPSNVMTVSARGLTKQFGSEMAVQDLNFDIPQGKIIGFIGPSGCGKTTTVRLMTGIYRPTAGQVNVFGLAPDRFNSQVRERMGYMPQLFVLYPDLSVWENMNFAASLYGMSLFRRNKRIHSLLEFVELDKDRHKLARKISGGMQRRLSLAATLIHNPELIFLDEPTAGIDPILRRKFWDQFAELKNTGRTLFITTQYVNEAAYCDMVGVMAEGHLLMMETPEGLRRRAFNGDVVDLTTEQPLGWNDINQLQQLPFVRGRASFQPGSNALRLVVDEASTAIPAILNWVSERNLQVKAVEEYLPPFDDVFVSIVEAARATQAENQTASGLIGEEVSNG